MAIGSKRIFILGAAAFLVLGLTLALFGLRADSARAQGEFYSWDIISLDFTNAPDELVAGPGGVASARSGDVADAGETITMTGEGTFMAPEGDRSNVVTGGGTWETFDSEGASTGSGTYVVTSVVRWEPAPGSLEGTNIVDNNGSAADSRAGLATFTIEYSDGSRGVLTVSCQLPTTPSEVQAVIQEGITATKGFVHYWNREDPAIGVDANRTVFHVIDAVPTPTETLLVPAGGSFVAWIYGDAMASEVFGDVEIAWIWAEGQWVSFVPVLGLTDFAVSLGDTLFINVGSATEIEVPVGP